MSSLDSRPKLLVDASDLWVIESIERKRAHLHHVVTLQRHRIEEFIERLFDEDSDRSHEIVEEVLQECGDPQKAVELLFEPAARIIGENWCADECDFLKVTIAVSRMQRLFRQMASEHPVAARRDVTHMALLAPAPGEQHLFGLSVVEDAFRRGGWDVDCCGFGEEDTMLRLAAANHYQVIGVSVSVERLLPHLVAFVKRLRAKSRNKSVVIIAGGSMVMQNPHGAIDAGFDLLAVDALSAVALADAAAGAQAVHPHMRMAAE